MKNLSDYLIPALIGILIGMSGGIYAGATITDAHNERDRTIAVRDAVSVALESTQTPLNCKDNAIIDALKSAARNGRHVDRFWLYFDTPESPIERPDFP